MRSISRTLTRLVAAAFVAAAAGAVVPSAPASAATCSSADGVSVVVDFHELGGGVRTACVADGGGQRASSLFPAAGFGLTYVQRQPGFVCRVSGAPADDPCVNTPPADAYWGLWWSDGKSGSWVYASSGAAGLTIPEGGYVAFSWTGSSSRSTPGVSPAKHVTAPTPTQSPTHAPASPSSHPTSTASGSASSQAPGQSSSSADPTSSASPTAADGSAEPGDKKKGAGPSRSAKPSATSSAPPSTTSSATPETSDEVLPASSDAAEPTDGGLPAWVAPAVIALLFAGAGGAAVLRRRRGTSGP